jgi:hypothetical protein
VGRILLLLLLEGCTEDMGAEAAETGTELANECRGEETRDAGDADGSNAHSDGAAVADKASANTVADGETAATIATGGYEFGATLDEDDRPGCEHESSMALPTLRPILLTAAAAEEAAAAESDSLPARAAVTPRNAPCSSWSAQHSRSSTRRSSSVNCPRRSASYSAAC